MAEQIPLKAVKSSGVATALAEYAHGDYDAPIYLPPIFTDYISGLVMTWISGTSISISSGASYVPSLGYVLAFPAAITKSGLSLSASTWYHVYGYLNGATPDIDISTTAPDTAYSGTARTKAGDNSRRYLGSIKTDSSGAVLSFSMNRGTINYRATGGGSPPFRVLNNGTSVADTVVSMAAVLPVTSRQAQVFIQNLSTNAFVRISAPGDASPHFFVANKNAGTPSVYIDMYTDASQAIRYGWDVAPTGGGAYIDVFSYDFER